MKIRNLGVFVLLVILLDSTFAFAGNKANPMAKNPPPTNLFQRVVYIPGIQLIMSDYLKDSHREAYTALANGDTTRGHEILRYLPEFIPLPEVTLDDVNHLAGIETSILAPMPAFGAAVTKNTVGLYKAVWGRYPDLTQCFSRQLERNFNPKEAREKYQYWDKHPLMPLICTTSKEDEAFAAKLTEEYNRVIAPVTGHKRNFTIMSGPQNEYTRRGRTSSGQIITTAFFFGDDFTQLENYAFIDSNSGDTAHNVNEDPPSFNPKLHSHPFGVKQILGNILERDSLGVSRGGAFNYDARGLRPNGIYRMSPDWMLKVQNSRNIATGSRLAETSELPETVEF